MIAKSFLYAGLALGMFLSTAVSAQTPGLTAIEQHCREEGHHALYRGQERDAGWSVTDSILYTRKHYLATRQSADEIAQWDALTRSVYKHWRVPPAVLRQLTETLCLESHEAGMTTKTSDRY